MGFDIIFVFITILISLIDTSKPTAGIKPYVEYHSALL